MEKLNLEKKWDKVFPQSEKVDHSKITFHNRYGITLAADMYIPKNITGKLPAIAVSGPFGAVKEQSSGLYAQKMAEYGFLTIAFDPSFTGESGGSPRYVSSPDINTEDFCAAVDFLSVQDNVDADRIEEIRSAVLLVHGENAHSRYFSETAFEHLTGENKELMIIPGANHVDLYDQMDVIPFEKLKEFFGKFL